MNLSVALLHVSTLVGAPAPELPAVRPAPAVYALVQLSGDGMNDDAVKYRRAQAGHVRQPRVLQAATKSPLVVSLTFIRNLKNPEEWLKDNLMVDWTHEEVLRIGLDGSPVEQLAVVVDAVAEAYVKEWVEMMRASRKKLLPGLLADVRRKEELLAESRKSLDKPLSPESLELLRKDLAVRENHLKESKEYCNRMERAVKLDLPKVAVVRRASSDKVKE